jgi:deoxyribonuclease-4
MTAISIGAHVDQTDPIAEAKARGTTLVQFFLGDPQGYKGPEVRYAGGAAGLRADAEAAGIDLYVHAPYIVNVATTNNRIRIPSRKLLQQHVDAAAALGANGQIVHGGPDNRAHDPPVGFDNWRQAVEATDL